MQQGFDPRLETERLGLDLFREADYPDVHKLMSDPRVVFWRPSPMTATETRAWFEERCPSKAAEGLGYRAIHLKSGAFVGQVALQPLAGTPDVELAYHLKPTAWGRGYATEAARALLAYGFTRLGLERIVALVLPTNRPSLAVITRLGMIATRERIHAGLIHRHFMMTRTDFVGAAKAV